MKNILSGSRKLGANFWIRSPCTYKEFGRKYEQNRTLILLQLYDLGIQPKIPNGGGGGGAHNGQV